MRRFFTCTLGLLLFFSCALKGDDGNRRLEAFDVRWATELKSQLISIERLINNRLPLYLKGAVYDVRKSLTPAGVEFGKTDFAWFNPKSGLLVVNTSAQNIPLIAAIVDAQNADWPVNLNLDATISIGSSSGTKAHQKLMHCRVSTKSGHLCAVTQNGNSESGYNLEFEPIIGPDGQTVDFNVALKITYKGHEYATTTNFAVVAGKTHTLVIGTTPDKQDISISITVNKEVVLAEGLLDDPKRKAELLNYVRKELAK